MSSYTRRLAKLNKFNLTHGHKTSMDMGYLVPIGCIETLPAAWYKISDEFLLRFMPTLSPTMHIFRCGIHVWYLPYRIMMKNKERWEAFLTGGTKTGTEGDSVVLPTVKAGSEGFAVGSLADHFGIATGVPDLEVSAFPFRAYAMIYNEWYRNESIQDEVPLSLEDGLDTTTNMDLLKRCWSRDYFTDCLPSPQKGPSVLMPMGDSAPVVADGKSIWLKPSPGDSEVPTGDDNSILNSPSIGLYPGAVADGFGFGSQTGLKVDLANASAPTINQLRLASTIQQFQELNNLGGNRLVEFTWNHYHCRVPDSTLQRPLYLGGSTSNIVISEVLQTSETTNNSAQGTMAGHGIGAGQMPTINFHCTEHGLIIFLMSVMPQTGYFQGVPRMFRKKTRYEFGIPLLSHIGEQGVKNAEIYAQGTDEDDEVFGYQPNYQEYRQIPSQATGQFRTTLDFWHADRKFSELPRLNSDFVESNPTKRIFAVEGIEGDDHLLVQVVHHIKALLPLPKYGTPGIHVL